MKMTITTELAQRVRHWAECAALTSDRISCLSVEQLDEIADALAAKDTENERLARDLLERNGDIEGLRQRVAEMESQRQMAFMACNRWADKFRDAESKLEARPEQQPVKSEPFGYLRVVSGNAFQIMEGSTRPPDRSGDCVGPWFPVWTAAPAAQPVTVKLPPSAPENLASVLDGYEKWLVATTFRDTWNACLSEVVRINAAGITIAEGE